MLVETIQLTHFLETGNFGEFREIYFGMGRERMLNVLGEAEWLHFYSKRKKHPSIYAYGNVEFHFEDGEHGRLWGIQLIPDDEAGLNRYLDWDDGGILQHLDYESILSSLRKNAITYVGILSEQDEKDIRRIKTKGRVELIFMENATGTYILWKISKFVKLHSLAEPHKQLGFSIPASDYEKLRQLANRQQISLAKLCQRIIQEKLCETSKVS